MNKPTINQQKQCLSYIRFSSSKQHGNSSVDRQSPIAERVAKENGWIYRPDWNAKDLGVSAFKGDNVKTIRTIIQSVTDGKIPQGSVLVLESLDRATRMKLDDAQQLIRDVLKGGLEIYTDMNRRHLTAKSLNSITDVMLTAVELDAAHQYANRQSERATKGIDKQIKAIEKGEKIYIGGQMPSYIRGVENGKFVIDEERLKAVRHIFAEYQKGTSLFKIAIQLNTGGFITGLKRKKVNKWDRQTVRHILSNKAYTGDYSLRGTTYKNYLPIQVVSNKEFDVIQDKIKLNATRRGGSTSGNVNSIFNGVAKCSVCSSPMTAIISTDNGKRYSYYCCSSARYGKCKAKGFLKTLEYELDFCVTFLEKNPLDLIKKSDQKTLDNSSSLKAQLLDVEKKIESAIQLLDIGTGVDTIKAKLSSYKAVKTKIESELENESKSIQTAQNIPSAVATIKNLLGNFGAVNKEVKVPKYDLAFEFGKSEKKFDEAVKQCQALLKDNEIRKQLKAVIPQLVKRVDFNVQLGGYTITKHSGEISEFFEVDNPTMPKEESD